MGSPSQLCLWPSAMETKQAKEGNWESHSYVQEQWSHQACSRQAQTETDDATRRVWPGPKRTPLSSRLLPSIDRIAQLLLQEHQPSHLRGHHECPAAPVLNFLLIEVGSWHGTVAVGECLESRQAALYLLSRLELEPGGWLLAQAKWKEGR